MRSLASKPNVTAPGGNYPYGRIKDNTGSNDGTPVDEEVYGDFHQFFSKLMADAALAANGFPENSSDGFQLNLALGTVIGPSGTFTPTLTPITNVDVSPITVRKCFYIRRGNIVSGTIRATILTTAANTTTLLSFTLPVASTFATAYDGSGAGTADGGTGKIVSAIVSSSGSTLVVRFYAEAIATHEIAINFSYEVI